MSHQEPQSWMLTAYKWKQMSIKTALILIDLKEKNTPVLGICTKEITSTKKQKQNPPLSK